MIKFDIPLNEEIAKTQIELAVNLAFDKGIKSFKKTKYFILLFFIFAVAIGIKFDNFFNPASLIIWVYLFVLLICLIGYLTIKKYTLKNTLQLIKEAKKKNLNDHYEFTDNEMQYSNGETNVCIKWSGVKSFSIFRDNLFITTHKSILNSYIIGKNEISEDNYDKLNNLLSQKVAFRKYEE